MLCWLIFVRVVVGLALGQIVLAGIALEALQLGVESGEGVARHEVHHGDDGAVGSWGLFLI